MQKSGSTTAAVEEQVTTSPESQTAIVDPPSEQGAETRTSENLPPKHRGPDAEDVIQQWLRDLDIKSKLAILITWGYLNGDHGNTSDWMSDLLHEFEREIVEEAKIDSGQLQGLDHAMVGVAIEISVSR